MMKNFILFILISTVTINLVFADIDQRRTELIKVLDEELREVTRLNKQIGSNRPDLILRMAQILLEKGRLLKDVENQKYLETPAKSRESINKEEYFKESRRYFDQAQKTVLVLLKKFPRFDEKPDAYYILAYNAKELNQEEQATKFFQKVLDESRGTSTIADKSRIALAENYFNKGYFDKAMTFYEGALKAKRDRWWTKDAYHLGWCYFKVGKFDKAINIMLESYEASKSNKFIDMSRNVERDIAVFYTEAGRIEDAVSFYKKNGKSISEVMLKVGRYLKSQGKFTLSEKTLTEGIGFKKNEKEELEFNIELLGLYEKFGKDQKHLETSKSLAVQFTKGNLSSDQIEILKFNSQKMSALLQRQLVEKTYERQEDIRDKKAASAHDYFMINALLNADKSENDYFHSGETFFSIGKYDKAVPLYAEAIKRAQKNTNKKTEILASNALMVSLGKGVKASTSEEYLIPAYESYLANNSKNEKASVIYQRLFLAYVEKKNIPSSEKLLLNYKNALPSENEIQEKMLAQIMDYHKSQNNKAALSVWVNRIESKEFKVGPEFGAKIKTLVLGMQFEKVEAASLKGDKKGALKGYFQIYKSDESTLDAKKTAAYNIAILFYEIGDSKRMYLWADKIASLMSESELIKFEKDYVLFSTDLFQRRQFIESASLSEKLFDRFCHTNSKNKKVFFKNANIIYLSEKDFEKSKSLLNKASKCGIENEAIVAGNLDHLNELATVSKWSTYYETIKMLELSKETWPLLIYPSSLLAIELDNIGKADESRKIEEKMLLYYEYSKKQKLTIPVEALDSISLLRLGLIEVHLKKLSLGKLSFPEVEYNKALKNKFSILEKITNDAVSVAEMGSGIGIVKAYKYVVMGHEALRNDILNFSPEGKSPEYIESFKKSMAKLVEPLAKQATSFRETGIEKIEKENILSADNGWFLVKNEKFFIPNFLIESGTALMDKTGAK